MGREPDYEDVGCEFYPSCRGTEKNPRPDGEEYYVCPFYACFEDMTDSESETYDRKRAMAYRRWFFKEINETLLSR